MGPVSAEFVELVKFWCSRFREDNAHDADEAAVWYTDIEKWHEVATPAGALLALFSCSKLKGDALADINQDKLLQQLSEYHVLFSMLTILPNQIFTIHSESTIGECFLPSVVAKARQTCSAMVVKRALENLFNRSEAGSKRTRDVGGGGGTSTPPADKMGVQLAAMFHLCDATGIPGNDASDTTAMDVATRRANRLFCRCFTVGVCKELTPGTRMIVIAPLLWQDILTVIYDCAVQARCAGATMYGSLLSQQEDLGRFLKAAGRAEGWRPGWVLSIVRKIEHVRVLGDERLECSELQQKEATELYGVAERVGNLQFHVGQKIMLSSNALQRLMTLGNHPDAWLNDTLMDGYMHLLQRRDDRMSRNARREGQPYDSTVFVHSLVYTELRERCEQNYGVLTEEVFLKSPTLYNGLADVRGARLLMACNGNAKDHWEVIEVDFRNKYLRHYCSMGNQNNRMLSAVLQWLKLIAKHRIPAIADCVTKMQVENVPYWAPQTNAVDCGVFTLAAMDFLSLALPVEGIKQCHCKTLRVKYCWELFARKVALPGEATPPFSAQFKENLKCEFVTGSCVVDMTSTDDED
jgi:hypothetical protein